MWPFSTIQKDTINMGAIWKDIAEVWRQRAIHLEKEVEKYKIRLQMSDMLIDFLLEEGKHDVPAG